MSLYSIATLKIFSDSDVAKLGTSVAVSADGKTAVIGAPGTGCVYQTKLSDGHWGNLQLIASDSSNSELGLAVSISADGSVILIGAPSKSQTGNCVSVINGTTIPSFFALSPHPGDKFGYSVSMSYDGTMAIIGAVGVSNGKGAAYIFTRSDIVWTQQGITPLTYSAALNGDRFGTSVSMSADGHTVVIGAPASTGYAVVFVYSDLTATWIQQHPRLTNGSSDTGDSFGNSVAISADASTILVGAPEQGTNANANANGFSYVFTNFDNTWLPQGTLGAISDLNSHSDSIFFFGTSVALSCSGNIALIGAPGFSDGFPGYGGGPGAAFFFTRSGVKWSIASAPQMISDTSYNTSNPTLMESSFGGSVSLSADGVSAIVGDPSYPSASNQGLALIYRCGYDIPNISCFQAVGPRGPQGFTGSTGPIGPTGTQGPIGFQGLAGENLTDSAYLSQIILFALLLYGGFLLIFFAITFFD